MFAVVAAHIDRENPLRGLKLGDWRDPVVPDGWTVIAVRAAGLNHHDLWVLRGVGVTADRLPVVLGVECAGYDEHGNEVIAYPVVGDPRAGYGDETLDPRWQMLGAELDGTFADQVVVPRRNLIPKPAALSFEEAAALPGAWLTAYRMLFEKSGLTPSSTVLVQGAGGGVSTALIVLAAAAGHRVWVTSRSSAKREKARQLGADQVFATGARLPERVDAVFETVGKETWRHSLVAVRPGGRVVVAGATTGACAATDLDHVFYRHITIVGTSVGTCTQLGQLARFCARTGVRPIIDRAIPLTEARTGFAAMAAGNVFGKVVFTC